MNKSANKYIVRIPSDMPYEIKVELNAWYIESEPITRCKDCIYWATEARFTGMCIGKQFDPDGFCKWGKRKVE